MLSMKHEGFLKEIAPVAESGCIMYHYIFTYIQYISISPVLLDDIMFVPSELFFSEVWMWLAM
jgi:hypothetical protein